MIPSTIQRAIQSMVPTAAQKHNTVLYKVQHKVQCQVREKDSTKNGIKYCAKNINVRYQVRHNEQYKVRYRKCDTERRISVRLICRIAEQFIFESDSVTLARQREDMLVYVYVCDGQIHQNSRAAVATEMRMSIWGCSVTIHLIWGRNDVYRNSNERL